MTPTATPASNVIAAAVEYAQRGWSVIPTRADKRPCSPWKSRQAERARPEDVPAWFRRQRELAGVGIVLGGISGGLAVRDFDDADAYRRWAAAYPKQAETLPTVRTVRGFHIYVRWKGMETIKYPDGELRGEGSYVMAPPSVNAGGVVYTWLVPIPAEGVPELDPASIGLAQPWPATNPVRATESTERTESSEGIERTEDTEDPEDTEDEDAIRRGWSGETLKLIESATMRTLPPEFGRRNLHVFRFARALKGISALRAIPALRVRVLRPLVQEWHRRALPRMLTKDFGTTWGDFAHAWESVRHAEGDDVLGAALAAAEKADPPAWSVDYAPSQRLLASLCRELQRRAGDSPFFLSVKRAGECIGQDKGTASRWLKAFVADGAIRITTKGTQKSGQATRYRYVAEDLHESKYSGTMET